jgi:Holliday junction resolvase RusA-like endonuclease
MLKETAKFEVESIPVSVNNGIRYSTKTHRSYKTKPYKEWEKQFTYFPIQHIKYSQWYQIDIYVGFKLFYKNGNIKRKDIDDMLKYTIDCALSRVRDEEGEIDDKRILGGSFAKLPSDKEYTKILIAPVEIKDIKNHIKEIEHYFI